MDQYLQLRSVLREHSKYSWILETLRELPEWWAKASAALPILQDQGGSQLLTAWADDFNHSNPPSPAPDLGFPLPNIILTPIVAISQLVQYQQYCEQQPHARTSASGGRFETVGFCSGTLAAIAVASSPSVSQLDRYGRVAIRLAMLIGAMVDAVDNTSALGGAVSYSVSWNHPRLREHIDRTIHDHPSGYLSVFYDERRATLTLARRDAETVVRELEGIAGITLTAIGLKGRFHSNEYNADWMESIHRFCDSHPEFQFPDASKMAWRVRFGVDSGNQPTSSSQYLHRAAIEEILLHRCYWYQLVQQLLTELADSPFTLVVLGSDRCLPPSLMPYLRSLVEFAPAVGVSGVVDAHLQSSPRPLQDTDVAVIGMACKLPGANDLGEFWKLLCKPRSQHREVPQERMDMAVFKWRDSPSSTEWKWYGNFIDDYDAFDHRFFKKSPREAASMDPQQRLMLQTAYQAVAQAGHFVQDPSRRTRRVGCYIGVSNVDYENHVACHPANAYSATGTLKSFVAGKVSHFFGWTGPSLTIDTACSGAAVALHQACQGLLTGDCDEALAGGVNILASPLWFQNLAGASFLSPTGACKPFDASADGYCRGEGCGAVYLKRAKAALADGDPIIGIIPGTAVQQNENCTPITVPNSVSLTDLFRRVLDKSQLSPDQISVVEAHGTGTAVGDPAEYTSIQQVLGGPKRPRHNPVNLGSVKGLVGHLECASGIVSVLKILLMLKARTIPPHVGLETINPELAANSESQIEIPLSLRPWQAPFRAALINNYGASGSNASLVVMDAAGYYDQPRANDSSSLKRIPFYISALDDRALQAYCAKFLSYIASCRRSVSLDALAFNLSRQSNRDLGCVLTLGCTSIEDLEKQLREVQAGRRAWRSRVPQRPVILCFGGQTSTFVGLNRDVFISNPLLRMHLDECDRMCRSMALDGIYPEIFQKSPIEDVVKLQLALFALQYACAATWIDCGAPVAAVVGHSFGELTALCIAGVLSLEDTVRLIAGRAGLVRDSWGKDRGGMIAAEGDLPVIKSLLECANHRCGFPEGAGASIACVNGPRSFTLAGPTKAMDAIEAIVSEPAEQPQLGALRMKRLNVSNAFHSTLVQPLTRDLELLGQSLSFYPARIRVERSTECASPPPSTGRYVADHMRNPVYFHQAVQRLAHEYPSAIWLEAGSNSTITNMASRALDNPASSHFQPVNLTNDSSSVTFADVFIKLWDQGLSFVSFWPHHPSQGHRYEMLLLPPYQFELFRHLLPMTPREEQDVQGKVGSASSTKPGSEQDLWSFVGSHNAQSRFQIHMDNSKIQEYVTGHTVAGSAPLCPRTLQLELAIETISSLQPRLMQLQLQPQLRGLDNHNPLCMDPTRKVWLDAEAQDTDGYVWNWKMTSESTRTGLSNDRTLHVSGQIVFVSTEDEQLQAQFSRFERLVDYKQCLALLHNDEADDAILGPRNIYKAFSEVVDYGEVYRGVHKVVGQANRSAGRVVKKYTGSTWLDGPLCDSFCQVAGIFVNCMTDKAANEIRISNRIEQLIRRPQRAASSTPDEFHVLAVHSRPSDRVFLSDVFVFNPENGDLLGVILGIRYQAVNRIALGKALLRLTPGMTHQATDQSALPLPQATATTPMVHDAVPISLNQPCSQKKTAESQHQSVSDRLLMLLSNVTGVDATAIRPDTALADLGIDSLMCMELARDIGAAFQCELKPARLMELVSFSSLLDLLDGQNSSDEDGEPDRLSDDSQDINPLYRTAATTPDESDTEVQSALQSHHAAKMIAHRQSVIEEYVAQYTKDLTAPLPSLPLSPASSSCTDQSTVLVTGATGSLGSHLVAHLLRIPTVSKVICLNRRSGMPAENRQQHAFHSRNIPVDPASASKLYVYETDTSQHMLGLAADEYERLLSTVTHVVHNAWPMTIARPVQGFEAQFRTWRNMIELVRNATIRQSTPRPISIQFISSIATVGMYPLHKGDTVVPETHMTVESTLASGYGDAKLICEKMLEKTLQRFPTQFRASVVRLGQVAGSSVTGYWNPVEHLAFLFKSAKTLNILPNLPGELSWCPVNEAAAILTDLLLCPDPVPPVFHVENPVRQPWADMIAALARELDIRIGNIVPFEDWLNRMRNFVGDEAANPAKRVDDFLEEHFVRMACGGVVLDTQQTARLSARFRALKAVDPGMVKLFVEYWRKTGFMN
ncbi:hypothetical protein KXX21_001429 [Aspergillus fumigatus]|nr:hypothetical protein KXX21_001429 [Aspergillus fumigatus]